MGKVPLAQCGPCPLREATLVMPRGSDGPIDIVLIGEAPGRDEVRLNQVFIGRTGQLLQRCLDAYGLKSVWLTNACLCYCADVDHKEPASFYCRARLVAEIRSKSPKIVVPMGNVPTHALLGGATTGITNRRGKMVYLEELEVQVLPTFHPAAILRRPVIYTDFAADLLKAKQEAAGETPEVVQMPKAEATEDFHKALQAAARSEYTILDLETAGFDYSDKILCVVIGTEEGIFVITQEAVYDPDFAPALEACKTKWVGHSSKFDRAFLKVQLGIDVSFAFDTFLAHYALDERGEHDLKSVAARMFGAPDWEADIKKYLAKPATDSYALLPKGVLYRYGAFDGYYTRLLTEALVAKLRKFPNQLRLVNKTLVPASNALADVQARGIRVDLERARATAQTWQQELLVIRASLEEAAGRAINPNSSKQVATYLFDELGLRAVRGRSTDKVVIATLNERYEHPFLKGLTHYRHLMKLRGTYVVGLLKRAVGDRIHPSFLLHGTVTGRLSCRNPNLQNLPSDPDDPYGAQIRDLYIASKGMSLIYLDYSQAELRMIALLSEDPFLVEVYQQGRDLHDETSIVFFGKDFTSRNRFFAKAVNFGLPYGRTAAAIARDINIPGLTKGQAEEFITRYFERIPGAVAWINGIKQTVRAQGFIESRTGRRRRFPLRTDRVIAEIERQAVNFLPQGGASDTTLTSLFTMHREMPERAHILLTVHDSILLECPTEHVEDVARDGIALMERVGAELWGDLVPFKAAAEVGQRWGSLHPLSV